jgi:outer membrane protein assembly factor BamB
MWFKNRGVQGYIYLLLLTLALSGCSNRFQPSAVNKAEAKEKIPSAPEADTPRTSVSRQGEWVMEGYNPQRARATTEIILPPLVEAQEFATGLNTQFGSPAGVAGGLLFMEGDHSLHAFALDSGQELWFFNLPGSYISPAIAGEHVFVRAESGSEGYVVALTVNSGLRLWQFKFPIVGSAYGDFGGHVTSPVVVDDLVLVGASKVFRALDAKKGQEVWTFKTEEPITSSATVADGTVFFTDFNNLYAIDLKTGLERWHFAQGEAALIFSPVVIDDQIIVTNEDTVQALNRHTGKVLWRKTIAARKLIPAGAVGDMVYVKSINHLYALDRISGETLWEFAATDFVSLPAIAGDLIYLITRAKGMGQLRAISLVDGTEVWQADNERLANAAPIVAGHQVYVRTVDGSILIYTEG